MKKNCIGRLLSLLIAIVLIGACKGDRQKDTDTEGTSHSHATDSYTCPMHPQIVQDKPGSCPICGMDLVRRDVARGNIGSDTSIAYLLKPVNQSVVSSVPVIRMQEGSRILQTEVTGTVTFDPRFRSQISSRVSGRIERLYLKYNYQPVTKGQLIMEVYSPDLAAAQRELLYIIRSGNPENMLQRAKQRLLLLGMSARNIDQLIRTGKIIYRIPVYSNQSGFILEQGTVNTNAATVQAAASLGAGSGMSGMSESSASAPASTPNTNTPQTSPVLLREGQYISAGESLFTIYRTDGLLAEFALKPEAAGRLKVNTKILITKTGNQNISYNAAIGRIQPYISAGQNFTLARVYLKSDDFRAGEIVTGRIPIMLSEGSWLPKEAVLSLGNQFVIFIKDGQVFKPQPVKVGVSVGNEVQILGAEPHWQVASNAYFLIDSESFIRVENS